MNNNELIISSYLPIYRSPPDPLTAIEWTNVDFMRTFNLNIETSREWHGRGYNNSVGKRTLEAVFYQYLKAHPELLTYDQAEWQKAFCSNMLYTFHNCWGYRGTTASDAMIGATIDFPMEPDELLDFQYMQACFRVRIRELLHLVKLDRALLELHIRKRYADKRYRYFKKREYKHPEYWYDTNNWTGFKAGFIMDYFFFRIIKMNVRYQILHMPVNFRQEVHLENIIKADRVLIDMFENGTFQNGLANMMLALRVGGYAWTLFKEDINLTLDKYISHQLERFRNHVEPEPTQGREGQILQETGRITAEDIERMLRTPPEPVIIRLNEDGGFAEFLDNHYPAEVTIAGPEIQRDGDDHGG